MCWSSLVAALIVMTFITYGASLEITGPYVPQQNTKLFKVYQSKSWFLSLDIKPLGKANNWNNILHFTNYSDYSYPKLGDRMPAIWFWSGTTRLHIWNSVNGKLVSYNGDSELPINQYTNVRMKQTPNASGQYIFEI